MTNLRDLAQANGARDDFRALQSDSAVVMTGIARPTTRPDMPREILVIGPVREMARLGRSVTPCDGLVFADPTDIGAHMTTGIRPDLVVSGLFCGPLDAIEIAERLVQSGFSGRYRVVCGPLPFPAVVLGDLRAAAPGLDIDLFTLSAH